MIVPRMRGRNVRDATGQIDWTVTGEVAAGWRGFLAGIGARRQIETAHVSGMRKEKAAK